MGDGVGGSSKKLHRGGGSAGGKEGEREDGLLKAPGVGRYKAVKLKLGRR
ncbi:hypothetical protein IMZ48_35885 [Candidatus Bathyarchaeota archaeon]|nr:hypothetical protein [Candidatus Bathyarchaeota archaeon]